MRRWLPPLGLGLVLAILAWQLTLAATPRALMALAVSRVSKVGGVNTMTHAPLASAASRTIVRPSPDLAYSSCPYDLSKGAVLIEATPVAAPYWSLSVFDSLTNAVFVRNDAAGTRAPLRVVIAREGQTVPTNVQVVRVNGDRGVALIRILIDRGADFTAIDAARRTARCGVVAR